MIPSVLPGLARWQVHPFDRDAKGQLYVGGQENVMSIKIELALVAAVMTVGLASPALAHNVHHHYTSAQSTFCNCGGNAGTLYNYAQAQVDEGYWPSAAALGNSH
jgi:hypothetical protein